jgi:RNA polymerase sigma-70 factor (ECF subfamily)
MKDRQPVPTWDGDPMVRLKPHPGPAPAAPLDIGELYRTHAATVARWATRLGGPAVDAEDVVHEVFLVAHRRLREFRPDAKPSTWLFRTTDLIVRTHRRRARLRAWLRRSLAREDAGAPAAGVSPVEDLIERQRTRLVYRALDALGEKYRSVFVLFELEGLSGAEIATLTGINPSTVWVRLHRARARFVARVEALAAQERNNDNDKHDGERGEDAP